MDTIQPNNGDYVSFPGNGIKTDNLTAIDATIYINNDINLQGSNILDTGDIIAYFNGYNNTAILSNFNIISGDKVYAIDISANSLYISSISTNYLSLSSIGGTYGIYLSTILDNLIRASTTTSNVSEWSRFPALQTINIANNNIDNVQDISISNNAYINRAVVRGGGLQM